MYKLASVALVAALLVSSAPSAFAHHTGKGTHTKKVKSTAPQGATAPATSPQAPTK